MKVFTKLSHKYRARIDLYKENVSYISNNVFDTYEDAWNYAKNESKHFGVCGFCVVYSDVPEVDLPEDLFNAR